MSFLKKPKAPKSPSITDEEVAEQRLKQRQAAAMARGRESTILTGPQGVGGGSRPTNRSIITTGGI